VERRRPRRDRKATATTSGDGDSAEAATTGDGSEYRRRSSLPPVILNNDGSRPTPRDTNALPGCAETTTMDRVMRSAVGYALLFAVPPGVGAGVFIARIQGGSLALGVGFGVCLSLGIFLLVLYGASFGTTDIDRNEGR
jgi:hypothetical protein